MADRIWALLLLVAAGLAVVGSFVVNGCGEEPASEPAPVEPIYPE